MLILILPQAIQPHISIYIVNQLHLGLPTGLVKGKFIVIFSNPLFYFISHVSIQVLFIVMFHGYQIYDLKVFIKILKKLLRVNNLFLNKIVQKKMAVVFIFSFH